MTLKPFFRADQVGSLLRPQKLLDARLDWKAGKMSAKELRAVEDEAIAEVVKMQENLGLEAITDGEFRRENWWIDFISAIDGIEISEPDVDSAFHENPEHGGNYVPKNVLTTGKIGGGGTISIDDFDYLNQCTAKTAKVMIPSPSRIHFHGGRAAVSEDVYPSMDDFWADIVALYQAEIAELENHGCTYIQIDDPVLTYFLDERLRANTADIGEDPDKLLGLYGDVLNACMEKRSPDTYVSIHLCRGNAQSQWIAAGSYDAMAEELFPRVNVDAWFLEYDDDRSGGFEPLRFMPDGTKVVLGLITTKTGRMEDPDEIRARIDEAAKVMPLDSLALSPQCGFASIDIGNKIAFDEQTAKLKMMLDIAEEVWG
ncbi:MAG: 5-methyltetrahydropteroyltriglutamate--homocysteine S-methyltransferase [Alphaproteobacteria bacterium]